MTARSSIGPSFLPGLLNDTMPSLASHESSHSLACRSLKGKWTMDFGWTEEDSNRYSQIYSRTKLWPSPDPGFFTPSEWKLCASLGLLGLSVPKKYGGEGCGFL